MSTDFREDYLELLIDEIKKPELTCSGREQYWRKLVTHLRLGATRRFKELHCSDLIRLVFVPESEESIPVRQLSFEVLYQLMLCDSSLVNGIINQMAGDIFQHLVYAIMGDFADLKIVAENCLMRLLTHIMSATEALTLVVQLFASTTVDKEANGSSSDNTGLDYGNLCCRLLMWTVDRAPRSQVSHDTLTRFLGGLRVCVAQSCIADPLLHRLRLVCNKLTSKTISCSFNHVVMQIFQNQYQKQRRIQLGRLNIRPNSPATSSNDGINRFAQLSPIRSRHNTNSAFNNNNNNFSHSRRPKSASIQKSKYIL